MSESVESKFNGSCAADGEANMSALRVKAIPNQECVICMQHQETEMRLLRCGHRPLCAGCLVQWLNAQACLAARCPMRLCRAPKSDCSDLRDLVLQDSFVWLKDDALSIQACGEGLQGG